MMASFGIRLKKSYRKADAQPPAVNYAV